MMLIGGSASPLKIGAEAWPRQRRRWTKVQKQQLVAESLAPGASVSQVARRHEVNANLLFNWRRQARRGMLGGTRPVAASGESLPLIPITVTADDTDRPPVSDGRTGIIEIVLPSGEQLRVDAWVDEPALRRVLAAIRRPP